MIDMSICSIDTSRFAELTGANATEEFFLTACGAESLYDATRAEPNIYRGISTRGSKPKNSPTLDAGGERGCVPFSLVWPVQTSESL
ncbi:MAG: hypothetical protein OWT27_09770, partial [Firmicutes bacterium]|nr:hypothetical protein [Bacillota bacterium]